MYKLNVRFPIFLANVLNGDVDAASNFYRHTRDAPSLHSALLLQLLVLLPFSLVCFFHTLAPQWLVEPGYILGVISNVAHNNVQYLTTLMR